MTFPAKLFPSNKCLCSACHKTGRVVRLDLPETHYYDRRILSTRHREYWLCTDCGTALAKALGLLKPKPITNADRIRSMSDEELESFTDEIKSRARLATTLKNRAAFHELYDLEWLQQPAEEQKNAE